MKKRLTWLNKRDERILALKSIVRFCCKIVVVVVVVKRGANYSGFRCSWESNSLERRVKGDIFHS